MKNNIGSKRLVVGAGYGLIDQAVIDAASEYDRALPMMMTAAGTVPAAKVFVMGVGVAGLLAYVGVRKVKKVRAPERAIRQAQETKTLLKRN